MKQLLTVAIAVFCMCLSAHGQPRPNVHTVSINDRPAKKKVTSGSDLRNYANSLPDGDTIYLQPGHYGEMSSLSKKIVFVGIGHSDFRNSGGTVVSFSNITDLKGGASGSSFIGITVTGEVQAGYWDNGVNNITFEKCRLGAINLYTGYTTYQRTNWSFIGNIITGKIYNTSGVTPPIQNMFFFNNVFTKDSFFSGINSPLAERVTLVNNVFLGEHATPSKVFDGTCRFFQMQRNIFYGRFFGGTLNSVEVYDNIFYASGINSDADLGAGVTGPAGSNTYTDPVFINLPANHGGLFLSSYNLKRASNDNKGLHSSFNRYGTPFTPFVTGLQIASPVISQGGTLSITLSGASKVEDH